jgi:hypothetical protein
MPARFRLEYRYPDWLDDENEESKYLDRLIILADLIKNAAQKKFHLEVFYTVSCVTPEGNRTAFCSSDTPDITIIGDVPDEGPEYLQDPVLEFTDECLDLMHMWSKNNESVMSWWRLYQDGSAIRRAK